MYVYMCVCPSSDSKTEFSSGGKQMLQMEKGYIATLVGISFEELTRMGSSMDTESMCTKLATRIKGGL